MGSLRNPIGPLPSSIYWRRRAVAASLVALLAVLIVWAVTSGGDDDGKNTADGKGPAPAHSITPGPDQSGPAISQQPGGRDESGGGTSGSGGAGGSGDGSASPGGASGGDGATTGGPGTTGGASQGAPGVHVPAGSDLPNCAPGALRLTLSTTEVSYAPGEKPAFRLVVANSSPTTCKADFGPKAAVFTVTDREDKDVWSSGHCPRTAPSRFLSVPGNGTITHTVQWDRKRSAPQCPTTSPGGAAAGTYLVEVAFPGVKVLPASFRLDKD
ncbi:hypothetical protein QFZ82_003667 [Streptomyces sp. V4I23]|uniref:hypothetical protein n=1 Tax=Streptomyces sp. V4I23 TaxID=3042282 RepID=UPI00277FFE7A|nr:hypothetical protein [Streptomyces sp. V4I23]MDQ1009182.1 hypothetical protein [Streptomyces sp. V4I23]